MSRKTRVLLVGQPLVEVLQRTAPKIKMLNSYGTVLYQNGAPCLLTPNQAIALVLHGGYGQYVGETNPNYKRVYCMREFDLDWRPKELWVPTPEFWDDRAVLRYAADLRNIPIKMRNQELEDMWDRMLKMHPPPKSWKRP
jgi:hypothetical protein